MKGGKRNLQTLKKYICKTLKLWITFVPLVKKKKSIKNRNAEKLSI